MVRVAVDVTPLIGVRTGVAVFVQHLIEGMVDHAKADALGLETGGIVDAAGDVTILPYAVTWRGRNAVLSSIERRVEGSHDTDSPAVVQGWQHQRYPMPARPLRMAWRYFDHPSIEHWVGSVDVVHGTNYVSPPSRGGVELISVHDLTVVRFPEMCSPDTHVYPTLVRRALGRGAHIHTDSQYVADEVVGFFECSPDRVHVIALSVSSGSQSVDRSSSSDATVPVSGFMSSGEEHGLHSTALMGKTSITKSQTTEPFDGRPYLISVGTIEPRKDLPTLLRAFALLGGQHQDVQLVIVGQNGWGVEEFERALASLPSTVRKRVHRMGYLPDGVRHDLLANATAFVYPSRYEGFGLPPLEAMAEGIPVIATAVGSIPEVVGTAALLVPPADPSALAEAIESVLNDEHVVQHLRAEGFARVAHYSSDRMCASFIRLYGMLADS